MTDLPNVPGHLPFTMAQYIMWANQRARAARFAQDVEHMHTVSPGRPQKPPVVIFPSVDIEDIYEAADIRYADGTTLAERLAAKRPKND